MFHPSCVPPKIFHGGAAESTNESDTNFAKADVAWVGAKRLRRCTHGLSLYYAFYQPRLIRTGLPCGKSLVWIMI